MRAGGFRRTQISVWVTCCGGGGRAVLNSGLDPCIPGWETSPWRHDSTSPGAMATALRRFSIVNCVLMPGISKLPRGMRKVRAKGSPSGLNQTSANLSPLYFKAAHCFEGGCSEKFIPHPPPWTGFPVRQLRPGQLIPAGQGRFSSPWPSLSDVFSHCNADSERGKDRRSRSSVETTLLPSRVLAKGRMSVRNSSKVLPSGDPSLDLVPSHHSHAHLLCAILP